MIIIIDGRLMTKRGVREQQRRRVPAGTIGGIKLHSTCLSAVFRSGCVHALASTWIENPHLQKLQYLRRENGFRTTRQDSPRRLSVRYSSALLNHQPKN